MKAALVGAGLWMAAAACTPSGGCSTVDKLPVTRQAQPATGKTSTYCLPSALSVHALHPELPVRACIDFRLGDRPAVRTGSGDGLDGILGTEISPDNLSLTVIWTGNAADTAVVVEERHQVRVAINHGGPTSTTGDYFGATVRLDSPLAGRPVRLFHPERFCD